jgi:Tfp pilus assembly protein PilO
MKLQKREKILLGASGGIIVLAGLVIFFMTGDSRPYGTLLEDRKTKEGKLREKQKEMKAAAEDDRQLAEWRRRSLPRDPAIAQSLYDEWLHALCARAGLHGGVAVHSETVEKHHDIYTRIPFTIRAQATLDQIVAFLHGFYSAGNLQKIRHLEIKPIPNRSGEFDLHVSVEALSLRDADATEKLTAEAGHDLQLPSLAAYRDSIGKRNFFAVYVPPPPDRTETTGRTPPPPPPPVRVDPAKFAVVTGVTKAKDDGIWRVWLHDRMADRDWQLKEGEQFKVGSGTGQIRSIAPEGEVILRFDGKVRALRLGDDLRGGKELKE